MLMDPPTSQQQVTSIQSFIGFRIVFESIQFISGVAFLNFVLYNHAVESLVTVNGLQS